MIETMRSFRLPRALLLVLVPVLAGHFNAGPSLAQVLYIRPDPAKQEIRINQDGSAIDGVRSSSILYEWLIRPRLEGQPDETQHQLGPHEVFTIRNAVPGAIYVIGYKTKVMKSAYNEDGFTWSDWTEYRYTYMTPPSKLDVSDASSWSGDLYTGRARLTWHPASGAHHVTVRVNRQRTGQSTISWEETLPPGANSFETVALPLDRLEFHLYGVTKFGEKLVKCAPYDAACNRAHLMKMSLGYWLQVAGDEETELFAKWEVPLPTPKAPARPTASMLGTDSIRLVWHGDNVTESFEIERLQLPSGTDRVDRQSVGALAGAAPSAEGRVSAGITGQPKVRSAPATLTGGQSSPAAGAPSAGGGASPNWVKVLSMDKVGNDTRNHFAVDGIKTSAAVGGSIYEPYTYRVCAVNATGRTCSDAVELNPVQRRRELKIDRIR